MITRRGVIFRRLQRYLCRDCKKSFTLKLFGKRKRYSRDFVESAIKRYVEDNTTLRPVANSVGVSRQGLLNWLISYGRGSKSPLETAQELKPHWSGLLGIDGKELSINGNAFTLLVAQDIRTFDPVFFSVVERENVENARRFFLSIRDVLHYPIKGLVSDLGRGRAFIGLAEELFPGIPHQACVVHFWRYVIRTVPMSTRSLYYKENCIFRNIVKDCLFAKTFQEAEETFHRLLLARDRFTASYHKTIIRSLKRHFDLLTAHLHHCFLVRDNNITENLIRQLNKKLKQSGGFKNLYSAHCFLKLWFIYYRFKPFSNSQASYRIGKSPLQLAKIKTKNIDWLTFSQRNRHT